MGGHADINLFTDQVKQHRIAIQSVGDHAVILDLYADPYGRLAKWARRSGSMNSYFM